MKKVLLALDCSVHSKRMMEYAAGIVSSVPGCQVILLAVTTGIPFDEETLPKLAEDVLPESELHGDEDHTLELEQVNRCFGWARSLLEDHGLPAERIEMQARALGRGIPLDILDAAREQECDTVVVGRRALSRVEALFTSSVSHDVVQHGVGLTVWVVE